MNYAWYLTAVLIVMFLGSCRQHQGTVIARVGDAVLTLEEASLAIDSSRGSVDRQLRAYVTSWVNTELLHQEAEKQDVEHSEKFERQVQDVTRQLAVQIFLDQHIYADTTSYGEAMLRDYFSNHAPEFFLREDMVKLNLIVLARREEASAFAASVSQGIPWRTAMEKIPHDNAQSQTINFSGMEQFYSRGTLVPPELWKIAPTLGVNEVSFPIKIANGYAVLQLLAFLKEGRQAEFDLVRDEVRQRVQLEQRRARYDELIASLRNKYRVQVLLPQEPSSDTTQSVPHE